MKKIIWIILALGLILPSLVFAKGQFSYLAVKGPGLVGELDITDPALTDNFMAFADFSKGSIEKPADPGQGYQIIRMYVEDNKGQAFDVLHYYPYKDTGYVYYDGIVNGSSEYDRRWFIADPAAEKPFRAALAKNARLTWTTFGVFGVILTAFFITYYRKPKSS